MKITKSQLRQIIKEELEAELVDSLDEAEEGDFDPEAAINQPGADPSEKEIEAEKEKVRLARLKDDIRKLLKDPDASDIQTAKDKLGGYGSKKES